MKTLKLTEYRDDGGFYPILVCFGEGIQVREVNLLPNGPHIIGESKALGKGSLITGLPGGQSITVQETVEEIYRKL